MNRFVVHQHHARRLHWDLRLERDGVLVCWAVPRGLPNDPRVNHLAVHTEDHPLEFLDSGESKPPGRYGPGETYLYDRGTYDAEKWRDDEAIVVLSGSVVVGRFALIHTRRDDWLIHRMDGPPSGWSPPPSEVVERGPAAYVSRSRLPSSRSSGSGSSGSGSSGSSRSGAGGWAYELAWKGERVLATARFGRVECQPAVDVPRPVRKLGEALAPIECVLDGWLVPLGGGALLVSDLLWLNGASTMDLPYAERRALLDTLGLDGPAWQLPPSFPDPVSAGRAAREVGAAGVVAKPLVGGYGERWIARWSAH